MYVVKKLIVFLGQREYDSSVTKCLDFAEFIALFCIKNIHSIFKSYDVVEFNTAKMEFVYRRFFIACMCWFLAKDKAYFLDDEGNKINITLLYLFKEMGVFILQHLFVIFDYIHHIINLKSIHSVDKKWLQNGLGLYLRENVPVGLISGGSIGHAVGVINNLDKYCNQAIAISFESLPSINDNVLWNTVEMIVPYNNVKGYPSISSNNCFYEKINEIVGKNEVKFIYQRCSLNAYAGLLYATKHRIPFILEYNSPEIWTLKNWGNGRAPFVSFSEEVEQKLLDNADLITCVSTALKNMLIDRGVNQNKIIVTPNSVNINMYSPNLSGKEVRCKYAIKDNDIIVGFIGTFGKWHGAEILVEAFSLLLKRCENASNVKLLLIGDGLMMKTVKEIVHREKIESYVIITGSIAQGKGPSFLAACDILVNPTIPNPDGTPFFGSPTKLFEYMAMGKAIIASDMDQMSEVLEDKEDALLVIPGSVESLLQAIEKLVNCKDLRDRLGKNARKKVCERYTWDKHVDNILGHLDKNSLDIKK